MDLCNANGETVKTLDNWETLVFHGADGSNTIEYLVDQLSQSHPQHDAEYYHGHIKKALDMLVGSINAVVLNSYKDNPPEQFELPLPSSDNFKKDG